MSIMTIDPQTYDNIQVQTIAGFVDQGFDLLAARNLAKEYMKRSFRKGNNTDRDDELDQKENGIYG